VIKKNSNPRGIISTHVKVLNNLKDIIKSVKNNPRYSDNAEYLSDLMYILDITENSIKKKIVELEVACE